MGKPAEVVALVEGETEKIFVASVLAPYLIDRAYVSMTPTILGKRGGNVQFGRAERDIGTHLKQRSDTWVTLVVDYYGIRNTWPGYQKSKRITGHEEKARLLMEATVEKLSGQFGEDQVRKRFVPYVSMFELESLWFSDSEILAKHLGVDSRKVRTILDDCGAPEEIDDSPTSAPSKRLYGLAAGFKKTTTGISIAREIGIPRMKAACPLFGRWVARLEELGTR